MIRRQITQQELQLCSDFAKQVVGETYNRFNQNYQTRTDRIFYGKLGELIFLNYLKSLGKNPDVGGMFEVYEGETNVDSFDFITNDGQSVDVKTGYKDFHKRILIPWDQFEDGRNKNFYVGIKINLPNNEAFIYGYITSGALARNGKKDFGEGEAYYEYLANLRAIEELVNMF